MSNYRKITRHPQSRNWEVAQYYDDYFGPHLYGVEFESDKKVYPLSLVNEKQPRTFSPEDVMDAYCYMNGFAATDEATINFLNQIEKQYRKTVQNR